MRSKKFITVICTLLALACLFCACSKSADSDKKEDETTKFEVTEDSVYTTNASETTTDESEVVFYDRYGKSYNQLTELPYYAQNGKIYYYSKSNGKACFVDTDKKEYDVNKCFIDPKGYFVYDEEGDITLDQSSLSATSSTGTTYFPAVTIRWTVDHKMQLAFGFGKELEMLDDDMEIE